MKIPLRVRKIVFGMKLFFYMRDAWSFIKNECYTEDPHDEENNIKLIPDKEYLRKTVEYWIKHKILIIVKSRQMMITWLMLALHLWLVLFKVGQRIYIQAQKQEDAEELLERLIFIYDHLPIEFRQYCRVEKRTLNRIIFSNRSQILGLAKGGNQIRQKTASAIFSDEFAFQEDADKAYQAMRPTVTGGGRLTLVSTPEVGFMCELVHDRIVLKNAS